jgi:hypothetical protein
VFKAGVVARRGVRARRGGQRGEGGEDRRRHKGREDSGQTARDRTDANCARRVRRGCEDVAHRIAAGGAARPQSRGKDFTAGATAKQRAPLRRAKRARYSRRRRHSRRELATACMTGDVAVFRSVLPEDRQTAFPESGFGSRRKRTAQKGTDGLDRFPSLRLSLPKIGAVLAGRRRCVAGSRRVRLAIAAKTRLRTINRHSRTIDAASESIKPPSTWPSGRCQRRRSASERNDRRGS